MKLGLISSAWVGSPVTTERGIRLTKEIGFDAIDIFADPLEIDGRERQLIRDTCHHVGLPVVSVVCCALGIADFNAPVRQFHIHRAKRYLDFGRELKARNLLLVVGEYIWQQEVIPPAQQWGWTVEGLRDLGRYAGALGLEIVVELEPFHLSIVNSISKMAQLLDDVGHPSVRANVDISHLVLAHNEPSEVAYLRGRIGHVHLSDCDGVKHGDLPPGRGVVPFLPYLQALKDADFTGTVSIELEYSPEPSKIVDWVREAYNETARMMDQLQIRTTAAGSTKAQ